MQNLVLLGFVLFEQRLHKIVYTEAQLLNCITTIFYIFC